jgi:hypothetical protein
MKLSQLIAEAQHFIQQHGDREVIYNDEGGFCHADGFVADEYEDLDKEETIPVARIRHEDEIAIVQIPPDWKPNEPDYNRQAIKDITIAEFGHCHCSHCTCNKELDK